MNFHYCELCNQGFRFGSAKDLVDMHYTRNTHKYELSSKVNFLQNLEAKALVQIYLKNEEAKIQEQKLFEKQKPLDVITRKCEVCFEVIPENYEEYVLHILEKHNLNIVQSEIKDTYIYQCVATGQLRGRACEICRSDVGKNVFDYIMHINLEHKLLINSNLKNYVKDPYVISVVLGKDFTLKNKSSATTTCGVCGEALDLDDLLELKNHKEKHLKFDSLKKSFHQGEKMYNPNYNKQVESFNNTNNSKGNLGTGNLGNLNQNVSTNIIQGLTNIDKGFQGMSNVIIINNNINSNNASSNVTNYNNSNINSNVNSNINSNNNNGQNSEEVKKLTKQLEDLSLKLDSLQTEQKKAEEEKTKLNEFVQKKFTEKDFKMSQIQKDLERISQLEETINKYNSQIEELQNSDKELKNKLDSQEKRIDDLDAKINERIKELQLQFTFFNQQQGTSFSDKLNEVEKELLLLQANIEKKKGKDSDINFSLPSHWSFQKDYLSIVGVDMFSNEYSKIESLFLDTFNKSSSKKAKIKSIKRIQNTETWKNYCFAKHQLLLKGNAEEKLLFHGSSTTDPALIYEGKEEGFDLRFARGGYFGHAMYFHSDSCYSDSYSFKTQNGTKILIVANVLIGNFIEVEHNSLSEKFKHPPFIKGSNGRYDSVKEKQGDKFMIYNNLRAYPHYLIEYSD